MNEEEPALHALCPVCGDWGSLMGHLGNLTWFRCVSCGIDFNLTSEDNKDA